MNTLAELLTLEPCASASSATERHADGQHKVLLEVSDLSVHFTIRDQKSWFWQPAKTLQAVAGVSLNLREGETLGVLSCWLS